MKTYRSNQSKLSGISSTKTTHQSKVPNITGAAKLAQSKPLEISLKDKGLHPRNKHRNGYDFPTLIGNYPQLKTFVCLNPYGNLSIDFADAEAVKALNAALLSSEYRIDAWDIPQGFLCPPVPGRVDYLHYLADLLTQSSGSTKQNQPPKGRKICVLDIGTGANGIYPLLGCSSYGWRFVASDIDPTSLDNLASIRDSNPHISDLLELRQQHQASQVFNGIIKPNDRFDLTMCNPPFHASLEEAVQGNQKKVANLAANQKKRSGRSRIASAAKLNFGGQKAELWCEGGERQFLRTMMNESKNFAHQCLWFTSLVSKKENVKPCLEWLNKIGATQIEVIEMAQGNKITRVIAWSFMNEKQRQIWSQFPR